jgi:predicted RNase H-like HicB family nuclease
VYYLRQTCRSQYGIDISELSAKMIIEDVIRNPDRVDVGYKERLIAQKGFNGTRAVRVVYESHHDKVYVVTVYPGRRYLIMIRHFTLEYWIDEEWYVGRIKEVPGVFSQGETLNELEKNIREAYKLMIEEEEPVWTSVQQKEIEVEV